jgi:hypothetical protein
MSMGSMRRVESRTEGEVGAAPRGDRSTDPRDTSPSKKSKLYVQPDELAHKLVAEMESGKASRASGVTVCNIYTVYLCPEDFERLERRQDQICSRLERHLAKHVRAKKYHLVDEVVVSMVADPDLKLGRFGLLAERSALEDLPGPTAAVPAVGGASGSSPSGSSPSGLEPSQLAGTTAVIQPDEAVEGGLAHQTIVIRAGNRVREFNHGRVIVGRAKDADFRVDDPNVSRRHAAIFWAEGSLMVMDLDSTNGTMVNGYPVSSTVLGPNDVVTIGECRITVETR